MFGTHFALAFISRLEDDMLFQAKIIFVDEATFHLLGSVN
jgi:hypothetical protein